MAFGRIFLFLFVFALLEIMVLAAVADLIGWPITVALVIATSLLGSALFRRQGLDTWRRLNQRMNQGELPGREMVESVMLLLGGMLLITPGFISDVAGLVLLLPPSRRALTSAIMRRGTMQAFAGRGGGAFFYQSRSGPQGPAPDAASRHGEIIEGEARADDPAELDRPPEDQPPRR